MVPYSYHSGIHYSTWSRINNTKPICRLFSLVVDFLQDSGTLIHIQDYTFRLSRMYFIDPVWLCDTLVNVVRLENDDPYAHEGIVRDTQLKVLCKDSGFGEARYREYIQLLARFEIALSTNRHR